MPQHSKKRPRTLIPKTSNRYKVRVLTPHSFTIENLQKPTRRAPLKPARSVALNRANIECFVDKLMRATDKQAKILTWAQQAENLLAQRDKRAPRMIDVREAASIFCHRLLKDEPSAIALLPQLCDHRKDTLIDKWEQQAEAADSSS